MVDTKKTDSIRAISICCGGTEFSGVKIAYFPLIRSNNILDIEQVIVSVCDKCITFTSIYGKTTRKLYFNAGEVEEESDDEDIFISETKKENKCLVFEIYK